MSEQEGSSYHPVVLDLEAPSEIPSGTEDRFADVEIRRDLMTHMREGVCLCADVYLPAVITITSVETGRSRPRDEQGLEDKDRIGQIQVVVLIRITAQKEGKPALGLSADRQGTAAKIQDGEGLI